MRVILNFKMFILKGLTFLLQSLKSVKDWTLFYLVVLFFIVTRGRCPTGPLGFHWKRSLNMNILKGTIGERRMGHGNGILLSDRPIKIGEKINVKLSCRTIYDGGIYVGFTKFNPNILSLRVLRPEFQLLSRQQPNPGVWLHRLTELEKAEASMYLTFWLSPQGILEYRINKKPESLNCRLEANPIPTAIPLWACFDFSGRFDRIEIINEMPYFHKISTRPQFPRLREVGFYARFPGTTLNNRGFVRINTPRQCITSKIYHANESFDCIVCEDQVTLATLPCMHACMCLPCLKTFLHYASPMDETLVPTLGLLQQEPFITRACPICRQAVRGIIGPY